MHISKKVFGSWTSLVNIIVDGAPAQLNQQQWYGPLARYVNLRVAHAPGMPGTYSPPPTSKGTASCRSRHASRHVHDARAVMHVGIANPRWPGKRSRRMRNPRFYVSGKRPIDREMFTLSPPPPPNPKVFKLPLPFQCCLIKSFF